MSAEVELQTMRMELRMAREREQALTRRMDDYHQQLREVPVQIAARLAGENEPEVINARLRRLQEVTDSLDGGGSGASSADGTAGAGFDGGGDDEPTDYSDFGDVFTPGDASTPGASVTAEVRTRGGTAELKGFDEYVPSTIPRKYLTRTINQVMNWNTYGVSPCTTVVGGDYFITLVGAATYDPTTDVITPVSGTSNSGTPPPYTSYAISSDAISIDSNFMQSPMLTTLTRSSAVKPACSSFTSGYVTATGSALETLTNEDTDAHAVARLLATSPAWSSYATCGAYPCASATWAARTTGFTFAYGEAELRLTFAGMPAGWLFSAKVTLARVSAATSEVSVVEVQTYEATPDGGGAASMTISLVPEEAGYTYRVEGVTLLR
ncbi:MAG: hypothetical protein WC205_04285 [Opitutaceae bacterium]|jgi:hypothetical protein